MPSLQVLTIYDCPKLKTFPYRLMSLNLLKVLRIVKCPEFEKLPPLGKLPCLEELHLRGMEVKRVGVEFMGIEKEKDASTSFLSFPNLKKLSFYGFTKWEEWDDIDEWLMERINNKTITIMPSLQKLFIHYCPKLKTFPYRLMSLNLLKVLTIRHCPKYEELPPLGKLSCLEGLYLERMSVKRVGVEFMGIEKEKDASTSFLSFPKLKILTFHCFRKWEEWDDIDKWLIERINNKTITIMPSLQELYIKDCPRLKALPYHLLSPPITTGIQRLSIMGRNVLEQEVVKDKLSHISHLAI
ncbi:hypothetical protein K2173_000916 [Erythroxylum novogranatense]|uniref:R13L1/DRL21-like LRR repeat region domain-containing protein n=1 Tax=Erythroxylum novogranatense TaxID=1862640 RepID=A0AAV8TRQ4_9ROSI|nr:hypothetical protein K2173_000916 [Erythroxylum novogranatense]